MSILEEIKSKNKHKHKSNRIVFDNEVVTKDVAEKLIGEVNDEKLNKPTKKNGKSTDAAIQIQQFSKEIQEDDVHSKKKHKRKRNKEIKDSNNKTIKKHTKRETPEENDESATNSTDSEIEVLATNNTSAKKEESIRAGKKRRHLELLQQKKLQSELNLQQNCLNYLSKWKHNKSEWKFEKLKQIWLQQNLFDDTKVPDEFWNTIIEYFNNATGQVKTNILSNAVKIVDSAENLADESPEKTNTKYLRARDIVQNIQE